MKLLIVTGIYPPEIGGPATYSKMIKDKLPEFGFGVEVLPFSEVRRLPKIIRHITYFFKVLRLGRRVDVIFAQDPVSVGLPSLLATKILRKKFVIRMPGDYAWEQGKQRFGVEDSIDEFQYKKYCMRVECLRRLQRFVAKRADLVITPSDYFNNLVSKWGVQESKVKTIYNGIDLNTEFIIPNTYPDGKIILSAGRLVKWKGFDVLIKLMRELPDWNLVIIGDGPLKVELESLAKIEKVSDRVVFTGAISREEVFGWYKISTIFALNTSFESFSFQVVEAMSSSIPVIATNIGSLPEILSSGSEGLLLKPNDKDGFIQAIKDVELNEKKWQTYTTNAKRKSQKFTIDNTVKNLITILKTLKNESN